MIRKEKILAAGQFDLISSSIIEKANTKVSCIECKNNLDKITHVSDSETIPHLVVPGTLWPGRISVPATMIKSANWHVTMNCNYNCRFCFYKHMSGEFRDLEKAKYILAILRNKGIEKINFAGGEPLLYKSLNYLLKLAKEMEFTVSIVTNASLLDENNLKEMSRYVDWIGISVDSANEDVEKELGRGNGSHVEHVLKVCELVRQNGMKLKINTTVTRLNYFEDMKPFISLLCPDRWKVFQVLQMKGQNDDALDLILAEKDFETFKTINGGLLLNNNATPTFESADDMLDSYFIIGPYGDIVLSKGSQRSSIPLEVLEHMDLRDLVDAEKYLVRGGNYDWN